MERLSLGNEAIKQLMESGKRMAGPDRRQEIVLAAFACLATNGFEGLRMSTIW